MTQRILCIAHANCMDGFGAAACLKRYYGIAGLGSLLAFHWAEYGKPLPEEKVQNADTIYILDFSYPLEIMIALAQTKKRIVVLDHHKSAEKDLQGLDAILRQYNYASSCLFDMTKSGAGLTWDYFNEGRPRPTVIQAIENRDLWKDKEPDWNTIRAINSYLFSFPYDLYGKLYEELWEEDPIHIDSMILQGIAIDRKHLKDCIELCVKATEYHDIKLPQTDETIFNVPFINVPYTYASDCGNLLAENMGMAVCYFIKEGEIVCSFRSDGRYDVSAIAKQFGGGGHAKAAGCKIKSFAEMVLQDK